MKILVTGASGFIGSNLCAFLSQDKSNHIIAIDKVARPTLCTKFILCPLEEINWGNIQCDVVFHQAAIVDTLCRDKELMMKINYEAPRIMFEQLYKNGCRQFIWASSCAVYGNSMPPYKENTTLLNPLNIYSYSKMRFEKFARQFQSKTNAKVIGLRYSNVVGPNESHKGNMASMIYQMVQQMKNNLRPILFKDGTQKRDWVDVRDVVAANILAQKSNISGIFNCGSGVAHSFNDVVSCISSSLHKFLPPIYIDNLYANVYQSHTCCDMSLASKMIGFVPGYILESMISKLLQNEKI